MDKKVEKQIIFLLLIISIIFFSIAQIVPWASTKYEGNEGLSAYSWGMKSEMGSIPTSETGHASLLLFIQTFFNELDARSKLQNEYSEQFEPLEEDHNIYLVGVFLLFINWIISLIVIVFAIITFKNFYHNMETNVERNLKTTCALSITTIILYYISFVFLVIGSTKSMLSTLLPSSRDELMKLSVSWNLGFYLFLIGTILITIMVIKFSFTKFSKNMEKENENEFSKRKETGDKPEKEGKFCAKCGAKLEGNPAFCFNCGYKLR